MAANFLRLDDVRVAYASEGSPMPAVDGLSLRVDAREILAIVGPSGCGKTTLLKAIAGLVPLSSGALRWGTSSPRPATVFQAPRLLSWASVIDNVAFGLEAQGLPRREARERSRGLLGRVGLAEWGERYPRELSGGMQQRVNLARALGVGPDLILLDEPFAALDAQTRESMQFYLSRVADQEDVTAVLVTHQVDEAVYLADRVIVLSPRPARIVVEVAVPFERPRPLRLKRDPAFRAIEDQIWETLQEQAPDAEVA